MTHLIFGCGDVGRRIVKHLLALGVKKKEIHGLVNSQASEALAESLGIQAEVIDLDWMSHNLDCAHGANVYYTIAPQKSGTHDLRTQAAIKELESSQRKPNKLVLISTTGVYGDCGGQWVDEQSPTNAQTNRGQRRLSSEQQWLNWGVRQGVAVSILRAPGIYANSRIPLQRILNKTPVVVADECGYTNRVHADDLARACVLAMQKAHHGAIYNVTDGRPGKISEYLQAAAKQANLPALPEISMQEAEQTLSEGMLSYLSESRKISNQKIVAELNFELLYPDFRIGLQH